ncbi:FlgO family outer membrane protein [Thalassotalea ganghwensis]
MNKIIYILSALSLIGCSQTPELTYSNEAQLGQPTQVSVNQTPSSMIHQRVLTLANKLFSSAQTIEPSQPMAVGTFLPVTHLGGKVENIDDLIGHQLQESLITLATQAGLNVIEYKTMPIVKLKDNVDMMLSRNVEDLAKNFNAYYYLTGTYTEQAGQYVINARIIELRNQRVIAAATDYLPIDTMMEQRQVSLKNNMLYRSGY